MGDPIFLFLFYLQGMMMLVLWCGVLVYCKNWGDRIYFLMTTVCVGVVAFFFLKG